MLYRSNMNAHFVNIIITMMMMMMTVMLIIMIICVCLCIIFSCMNKETLLRKSLMCFPCFHKN